MSTLAFVSPATVLPRIVEQLRTDINPTLVNSLTETDLGIWATPVGITYVDGGWQDVLMPWLVLNYPPCLVLSSAKDEVRSNKGKDYEIAKWEDELRKSLASKKASASAKGTLTKPQQALVQAQLDKEATIRQYVAGIKANLERGLHFVRSLVAADVSEFRSYISSVASLLLGGALGRGSLLVGQGAFETYLVSPASLYTSARVKTSNRT